MNIAYQALENVHDYFVTIDNTFWQIRTKRTLVNATENQVQEGDNSPENIEIIPVYLDPFETYNYIQIKGEDVPKNLIPISWHELPLPIKQQIVQLEENEAIGVYDPERPSILFTG